MIMRFKFVLMAFSLACIAGIGSARADVYELTDNGETVNITIPVFRPSAAQAMPQPVRVRSTEPTQSMVYVPTLVANVAQRHAINPVLLDAVIRQESGYRVDARSPTGAMGLMQLMPGTARSLGVVNAFDVHENLDGGARYLKQQLNRFGGNVEHALAAYNAGPGAVLKYGGVPPYRETQLYVNTIVGRLALPVAPKLNR
jgi:soluble lytic murein transglycosylase-like protein